MPTKEAMIQSIGARAIAALAPLKKAPPYSHHCGPPYTKAPPKAPSPAVVGTPHGSAQPSHRSSSSRSHQIPPSHGGASSRSRHSLTRHTLPQSKESRRALSQILQAQNRELTHRTQQMASSVHQMKVDPVRLFFAGQPAQFTAKMKTPSEQLGGKSVRRLVSYFEEPWTTVNNKLSGSYENKTQSQLEVDDWNKRKTKAKDSLTRFLDDSIIRGVDIKASGHG